MTKVCPQCKLFNADDAVRCGCGCPLSEAGALEDWAASVLGGSAQVEDEVPAGAEESSRATVLPSRLPNPLGDPLRTFRHVVSFFNILEIGCLVISLPCILTGAFDSDAARGRFLIVLGFSLLFLPMAAPFTLWLWSILPGRAVNAFYLRSFRNDPATWPCRKAAQAALGRRFRLSGIRDPRRRGPRVLRYMDVSSLRDPILHAEVHEPGGRRGLEGAAVALPRGRPLCPDRSLRPYPVRSGGNRTLPPMPRFEADSVRRRLLRGPDAWRMQIAAGAGWLDPTLLPDIRVAIWNASKGGRKAFTASVRAFAAGLPAGVAGLKAEALPLAGGRDARGWPPVLGCGGRRRDGSGNRTELRPFWGLSARETRV